MFGGFFGTLVIRHRTILYDTNSVEQIFIISRGLKHVSEEPRTENKKHSSLTLYFVVFYLPLEGKIECNKDPITILELST